MEFIREITPLTRSDCFSMCSRSRSGYNFPFHAHEEMELNLILNAGGVKRIVGDHEQEITDFELVLVGPNLPHGWFTHNCKSTTIHEVTIQFYKDLLDDRFLKKNQLQKISQLFEAAKRGVSFPEEMIRQIAPKIIALNKERGFNALLGVFSILHELSEAVDTEILSDSTFNLEKYEYNSRRIENVFAYMNANFSKQITLADVSKVANMPEASFSRFIKNRTGYTFVDSLTEIRLGHLTRMLIDSTSSVAELAAKCGFNNIANFNRIFKSKKGCTPKEFKADYTGNTVFI